MTGLRRGRHVEGHHVAAGQQRFQTDVFHTLDGLWMAAVPQYVHAEGPAQGGHPLPDGPEADDAHGPSAELPAGIAQLPAVPVGLQKRVQIDDAFVPSQDQRHGVLRHRGRIDAGSTAHEDPSPRALSEVHIVIPGPGLDHPHLRGPVQQGGIDREVFRDERLRVSQAGAGQVRPGENHPPDRREEGPDPGLCVRGKAPDDDQIHGRVLTGNSCPGPCTCPPGPLPGPYRPPRTAGPAAIPAGCRRR